jgi:hypothetical protein
MTELDRAFEDLARTFLAEHPEVRHEWRDVKSRLHGDRIDLICGVDAPNEVFASLLGYQIALGLTKGEHHDFESFGRGLTDEQVAREAFERFVALLDRHGHLATKH